MRSAAAAIAAASLAVTLGGCTKTLRIEIGARRSSDGDIVMRLGVSGGLGIASDRGTFSLTQSVGYRYLAPRSHSATTTTRLLVRTGPLYTSAAFDIDEGGFDVAPAVAVPLHRLPEQLSPVDGISILSAGLQLRVGRHDDGLTTGADFVIGYDDLGGGSSAFASP